MNDLVLKYTFIGNAGVEKTSLLYTLKYNTFQNARQPTIGVDHYFIPIVINNKPIKIHIWDTAGQERYRSICNNFYKNSCVIFIIFDLTNKKSFDDLEYWITETNKFKDPNSDIVVIGTKSDLKNIRVVTEHEIKKYFESKNISYYETNAKSNYINYIINEVSTNVLKLLLNDKKKESESDVNDNITLLEEKHIKKRLCCS